MTATATANNNNPETAEVRTRGKNKTVYIVVAVVCVFVLAAIIAIAVVFTREDDPVEPVVKKSVATTAATTVAPTPQRFKSTMKLMRNWTSDLTNPSSPAYVSLANSVRTALLPALKKQHPSIADVEVTGFQQGSVIVLYDIVMNVSAPPANVTQLQTAISNVITSTNFTGLAVNKTFIPTITKVIPPTTTVAPTTAVAMTTVPPRQRFKSKMVLMRTWTADLANPSSPVYVSLVKNITTGLLPVFQKHHPSIENTEISKFTDYDPKKPGKTWVHYEIVMAANASNVNMTHLQMIISNVISTTNFTGFSVDKSIVPTITVVTTQRPSTTSAAVTMVTKVIPTKDTRQRIQSKIVLMRTWTADLTNPSSPVYVSLVKNITTGLLPALQKHHPSIENTEISKFTDYDPKKPGKTWVHYEIVMAANASNVNMTHLQIIISNVISTINFTGFSVDKSVVPTITVVTTQRPPGVTTTGVTTKGVAKDTRQRFQSHIVLLNLNESTRFILQNDSSSKEFMTFSANIKSALLPHMQKENLSVVAIEVTKFTKNPMVLLAHFNTILATGAKPANVTLLQAALENAVKIANFTGMEVRRTGIGKLSEVPMTTMSSMSINATIKANSTSAGNSTSNSTTANSTTPAPATTTTTLNATTTKKQ